MLITPLRLAYFSMKAYTYRPEEIGLLAWPSGELRLEGSIPVTDPAEADVFIVPGCLRLFNERGLGILPYFKQYEEKHAILDVSDDWINAIGTKAMILRCNMRSWMWAGDPNSVSLAWPVEDYASDCMELPEGGFKYDVSFQGWLSTDTRRQAAESCMQSYLKKDIACYSDFCGYIYDKPEGIRRRAEFRRSMRESRIALCPESIPGVFPYRYFEAMSAGRVPMLVASDYVFPFREDIRYEDFSILVSRADASFAGAIALDFIRTHSDEQLIEVGRMARQAWVQWLNSADWPRLHALAVARKLGLS